MGQGDQVGRWEMAESVLDPVQVLDQEVAPARGIAEERTHLGQRSGIDRPCAGADKPLHRGNGGLGHGVLSDHGNRCPLAAPHAGDTLHPHPVPQGGDQPVDQRLGPGQAQEIESQTRTVS